MRSAVVIVACAAMGCTVGTIDTSNPELDEASLDRAESYQTMPRINAKPYASDLGPFQINCYVTGDVTNYRKIHPDRSGANVTVAPGTVIVREVLDAAGKVSKLTIMAKGPAGFDPTLGDWWFGVTDPRGMPLVENGALMIGRLNQCHDCHRDRARDDFLFGVPSGT